MDLEDFFLPFLVLKMGSFHELSLLILYVIII